MNVELKHTLTVDEKAWYIRLYLWLYEATVSEITFCKLFWAYVFFIPVLIIWCILHLVFITVQEIDKSKNKRKIKAAIKPFLHHSWTILFWLTHGKQEKDTPSWQIRFLERAETTGFRLVNFLSPVWALTRTKTFGRILLGLGVLIALGTIGTVIVLFVVFWGTTKWILIGAAASLVLAGVFRLLLSKFPLDSIYFYIDRIILNFLRIMMIGYVAVKSNTCPRIEIQKEDKLK